MGFCAVFFVAAHIPGGIIFSFLVKIFFLLWIITNHTLGGLSVFFNQMIVGFGYTSAQSLLFGVSAGMFASFESTVSDLVFP
jgi:hypothetical protein